MPEVFQFLLNSLQKNTKKGILGLKYFWNRLAVWFVHVRLLNLKNLATLLLQQIICYKWATYSDYTSWSISFATNEIVIAFQDKSRYSEVIDSMSWMQILFKDDVTYARSDPDSIPVVTGVSLPSSWRRNTTKCQVWQKNLHQKTGISSGRKKLILSLLLNLMRRLYV